MHGQHVQVVFAVPDQFISSPFETRCHIQLGIGISIQESDLSVLLTPGVQQNFIVLVYYSFHESAPSVMTFSSWIESKLEAASKKKNKDPAETWYYVYSVIKIKALVVATMILSFLSLTDL